jgi:hypothetical protein
MPMALRTRGCSISNGIRVAFELLPKSLSREKNIGLDEPTFFTAMKN